ncbi:MAG: L-seryl-tRNA(Sec) selenium transferase [Nitrospirota bacterium]|nr:MAG: L-seryl-tRNA(Sec) selenium transferase [Nitrospirota bacterium]
MDDKRSLLRNLPSVDQIIKNELIEERLKEYPRAFGLMAARKVIDDNRERIRSGAQVRVDTDDIIREVLSSLDVLLSPNLRPVINATGIVIHTNLGRAPLPKDVLQNVMKVAEGYSNLEYDLDKGARGKRYSHIRELINEITGAEDCLIVNNNAAAVLLCLSALARGKEAIVSRGELIEIGGSFRIPEVMEQSGAILKEVGATNKTHLRDYEAAINENTGLLLKAHRSNFRISGFTSDVSVDDLSALGKKNGIVSMYDLGSGCLVDLNPLGIHDEPMVQNIVRSGIDITTFSGDKLLGGPQAGIIVGRKDLIQSIQKHPLTRALRVDKFTLSALESVFMIYADQELAKRRIPVLKMLYSSNEALKIRARRLSSALKKAGVKADISIRKDITRAGGGSLPDAEFVTWTVSVIPHKISVNTIEERLRKSNPPVIARISDDRLVLDVMTISTSQINQIVTAISTALSG